MVRDVLSNSIETSGNREVYSNYLSIRDRVLDMLEEAQRRDDLPSDYWDEELAGFDYMLDASPLVVRKLREHCYHLTGLRSYDYRRHHAHQCYKFAEKLQALQEQDDNHLLVPESRLLGGFGHVIEDKLINIDTLKFYESLIAMDKAGLLASFCGNNGERKIVIEIGAGWGGFAYQFKTLYPNTCYIIIDLPQTLLFSGVYLKTLFPHASVLLYGEKPSDSLLKGYESYDFILLPHFFFGEMQLARVDLAINMVSFQEMTSFQVDEYVRGLAEQGCPNFYSHNRDRSPHNSQLSTVSSILRRYYDVVEQKVLPVPYTNLSIPAVGGDKAKSPFSIRAAKSLVLKLFRGNNVHQERSVHEYRHLIGTLKL